MGASVQRGSCRRCLTLRLPVWVVGVGLVGLWVLIFHIPEVSPRIWLRLVDYGEKHLIRPGLRGRDPRNPQRMIIDTFLTEHAGRVKGLCLEFDEDNFMERYGCPKREILKYSKGAIQRKQTAPHTRTTFGDLFDDQVYRAGSIDTIFFTGDPSPCIWGSERGAEFSPLGPLAAVSWPWVPARGSLEP